MKMKESKNIDSYLGFVRKLKKVVKNKVAVIPIPNRVLATVAKNLKKRLIEIRERIETLLTKLY